jgi:hypothetical protein
MIQKNDFGHEFEVPPLPRTLLLKEPGARFFWARTSRTLEIALANKKSTVLVGLGGILDNTGVPRLEKTATP